jgi:DeoR family transcriptional regulator of aga operon
MIAQRLKAHRHLTIVTNSLAVAQEMLGAEGVNIVLTGGRVRPETASLVGSQSMDMLHRFNIQKGFFGAHGLTVEDGLKPKSSAGWSACAGKRLPCSMPPSGARSGWCRLPN